MNQYQKLKAQDGPDGFTAESYQTFRGVIPNPQTLWKNYRGGNIPKLIYETGIALITKPVKGTTRKENYRPICLNNIYAKFSTKY